VVVDSVHTVEIIGVFEMLNEHTYLQKSRPYTTEHDYYTYLPTLVFVYAGKSHSFCRILLGFAGQYCMAVLLGENVDTLMFILSQIFTTS